MFVRVAPLLLLLLAKAKQDGRSLDTVDGFNTNLLLCKKAPYLISKEAIPANLEFVHRVKICTYVWMKSADRHSTDKPVVDRELAMSARFRLFKGVFHRFALSFV